MNFNEYQKEAAKTRIVKYTPGYIYTALGLTGETGEVVEKVKKILRDGNMEISSERMEDIKKELGDVLWYLSQLSADLGFDFEDVASSNLEKLQDRQARGAIHSNGDNR